MAPAGDDRSPGGGGGAHAGARPPRRSLGRRPKAGGVLTK